MVFLILAFACLLELIGIQGHAEIFSIINQHFLLASTAFLFVSYLLGVIIRLFAVRIVDKASAVFLRNICREKGEWLDETFPYPKTLERYFLVNGMASVTELMKKLNTHYNDHQTGFFNYCKFFIQANNETVAKHIQENEAHIRFLAGIFFALIVSCCIGLFFSLVFLITQQSSFLQLLYIVLTVISLSVLAGILKWFREQRLMEVRNVWMSVHLLLQGAIPNTLKIEPDELVKRMTMEVTETHEVIQKDQFPSYN